MRCQFDHAESDSDQGSEIAENGDLADRLLGSELSRRFKSQLDRHRGPALVKQKKQLERRD